MLLSTWCPTCTPNLKFATPLLQVIHKENQAAVEDLIMRHFLAYPLDFYKNVSATALVQLPNLSINASTTKYLQVSRFKANIIWLCVSSISC